MYCVLNNNITLTSVSEEMISHYNYAKLNENLADHEVSNNAKNIIITVIAYCMHYGEVD